MPNLPAWHIVYVSRAVRPMTMGDLNSMLAKARFNNELHNITGLLLYGSGHFLQVLEGEARAISELFHRIRVDPRHTEVEMLLYGEGRRIFPDWSMGCLNLEVSEEIDRTALFQMLEYCELLRGVRSHQTSLGLVKQFKSVVQKAAAVEAETAA